MNPYALLAWAAAIALALAGGFKLGSDHEVASQAREDKHITEAVNAANATAAAAISGLKPKYTTITGKLEKEIEIRTEYRTCKLSPDGLLLANQALDPSAAYAVGSGKLPKADTATE
jgi:hypothetical protein